MPFLPPNQQHRSTEDIGNTVLIQKMTEKMMHLSETVDVNEPSDEELFWLLLHFFKKITKNDKLN